MIGGEGLGDEIIGALLQRADRHGDIPMTSHQDDGQIRVSRQHCFQQIVPIDARQTDIADDHARQRGRKARQRRLPVAVGFNFEAGDDEGIGKRGIEGAVIFDQENFLL